MMDTFEFDCGDRGRHIVQIIAPPASTRLAICAACVHMPGWFKIEAVCRILDRDLHRQLFPDAPCCAT